MNEENKISKIIEDLELIKNFDIGAWIVTYKEKAITLASGKSIWKRENHAKSAFTNHINNLYAYDKIKEWGFKDAQELSHYLQNIGIIKIKKL